MSVTLNTTTSHTT